MTTTTSGEPSPINAWLGYVPGVVLAALVAWAGIISSEWLGEQILGFERSPISGIMMAIIIGLAVGNGLSLPVWLQPGIRFSLKRLLKLGIILLGIRLSLGDVLSIGLLGLPVIIFCLAGALALAQFLSDRLKLSNRLGALIAVGTSICGATAIVATGPAIDAKEEELTYAIANITVFGIVAMFLYPFLANALFADSSLSAGLFLGTSIHETAQVAGSALIYEQQFNDPEALNVATVTKLVRNIFMIAVIPYMAYRYQRKTFVDSEQRLNLLRLFPVFILGFLCFAIIRTVGDATAAGDGQAFGFLTQADWDALVHTIRDWAEILLAIAMAGVGLGTRLQQLRQLGIKPFYVGFGAAMGVAGLSVLALFVLNALGVG